VGLKSVWTRKRLYLLACGGTEEHLFANCFDLETVRDCARELLHIVFEAELHEVVAVRYARSDKRVISDACLGLAESATEFFLRPPGNAAIVGR
jgi:hypothetical protein